MMFNLCCIAPLPRALASNLSVMDIINNQVTSDFIITRVNSHVCVCVRVCVIHDLFIVHYGFIMAVPFDLNYAFVGGVSSEGSRS